MKPTFYGITGADAAYREAHNIVPDANGVYPRLDMADRPVRMIPAFGIAGENVIPETASIEEIREEIRTGIAIIEGLEALLKSKKETQ
jgi:hypothetical protein